MEISFYHAWGMHASTRTSFGAEYSPGKDPRPTGSDCLLCNLRNHPPSARAMAALYVYLAKMS
jgi:hypothetical protein